VRTHPLRGTYKNFWRDFSIILNNFPSTTGVLRRFIYAPKPFFGPCSAPCIPRWKSLSYDAPAEPVVGLVGDASPYFLPFDAFELSIWASLALCFLPPHTFLATRLHATHPMSKDSGYATASPVQGIEQATSLTALGVVINDRLTAADRVSGLLTTYSRLPYALRVLPSKLWYPGVINAQRVLVQ